MRWLSVRIKKMLERWIFYKFILSLSYYAPLFELIFYRFLDQRLTSANINQIVKEKATINILIEAAAKSKNVKTYSELKLIIN